MTIRLSNGNGTHAGKYLHFLTAAILLITFCTPRGLSVENPAVHNSSGFGTVPQSTFGAGLVRSFNPFDSNGNLIITGNVRRGSHFRGDVPYNSTATFGATLGTSTLSSFLRDSANSEDIGGYSGYAIQPYYSPAETVTTMSPDSPAVLGSASTRIDGRSRLSQSSGITKVSDLAALQSRVFTGQPGPDDTADGIGLLQGMRTPSPTEPQSTQTDLYRAEKLFPGTDLMRRRNEQETGQQQSRGLQKDGSKEHSNFWDPQQYENYLKNALDESRSAGTETSRQSDSALVKQKNRVDGTIQTTDFGAFGQDEDLPGQPPAMGQTERNLINETPSALKNFPSGTGLTSQESPEKPQSRYITEFSEQAGEYDTKASGSDDFMNVRSSVPVNPNKDIQNTDTYDADRIDTLEQIQQRLDTLIKNIERASTRFNEQKAKSDELIPGLRQERIQSSQDGVDRHISEQINEQVTTNYNQPSVAPSNEFDSVGVPTEQDDLSTSQKPVSQSNRDSIYASHSQQSQQSSIVARARDIMGAYTSIDAFSEAKFKEYFRTGMEDLSAGRYYRAASAFTLASMYKPEDSLSLAGKGHALFAAGDYVSSALFISRALDLDPGYIRAQVDLPAILGGGDMVETRISDVEQWLSKSGSEQLNFLLAYVCYRTGKLEKAAGAINAAFEKMPQSIAVLAVKTAVDQAISVRR
jgi:tetratricopeptide (TPR) repeat protein